jgi:hypothetical protein
MRDLPLSSAAVKQAAGLAGQGATVQEIRTLAGGTHAHTYLIRTANPEHEFILREFPCGDDGARAESRVLSALGGLGGLAPAPAGQRRGRWAVRRGMDLDLAAAGQRRYHSRYPGHLG